jgi:hypothetical protein
VPRAAIGKADARSIVLDGHKNLPSVFQRETDFRHAIARKREGVDFRSAITASSDQYALLR